MTLKQKEDFFRSFQKTDSERPPLRFAIPSLNRSDVIAEKTVSSLTGAGVSPSDIFVFLSDPSEKNEYEKVLPKDCNVIPGKRGITAQRCFINSFFDDGDRIVSLDDDILIVRKEEKNCVPIDESFVDLSHRAFDFCDAIGLRMWGIQPLSNYNFSRHQSIAGLNMIMGIISGEYAGETDCQPTVEGQCEDLEKSLLHYQTYGGTLKLCDLNRKSKPFAPGGCDTFFGSKANRDSQCEEAYAYLLDRFPKLLQRKVNDSGEELRGTGSVKLLRSIVGSYPSLLLHTPYRPESSKLPDDSSGSRDRISREFLRRGFDLPTSWT